MKHFLPSRFSKNVVTVDLVGCGGTGSRLLPMLADLHVALRQLGHPAGLHVTVWDPDVVTEPSVGRTMFTASDIGQYKAAVLTERVNLTFGLMWRSIPDRYQFPYWHMERCGEPPNFVITCTDSLRSRVDLFRQMMTSGHAPPDYWLDCGNSADTGQVILGQVDGPLPTVVDVFPGMLEAAETEEEEPDSCTLAAALDHQGLFINRHMATWAGELLWRFFRDGYLEWHGVYVNARTGRVNPMPIQSAVREENLPALPAEAERRVRKRRRLRSRA